MQAVQPEPEQAAWNLFHGDCLAVLRTLPADSLDSVVSDPPAGIAFMGKAWDKDKGGRTEWVRWMTDVMRECLRVLKPGAHGLVWAIPRTSHWTATSLEYAGFEIGDVVTHLFGTGFPKSLDVSKAIDKAEGAEREIVGSKLGRPGMAKDGSNQRSGFDAAFGGKSSGILATDITAPATDDAKRWQGWGTALKPASEHWILVRKPCSEKTVAANVLKWGTGAINVDGCRVATSDNLNGGTYCGDNRPSSRDSFGNGVGGGVLKNGIGREYKQPIGRFPANLVLDEEAATMLDEQSGHLHGAGNKRDKTKPSPGGYGGSITGEKNPNYYKDSGGASRFFYVAKASKADRGEGNTHPTVKSTTLMSYLCRLVTPPGGVVLDPFMGSGSTGVAALAEGFRFVGIEQDAEYLGTAERRLLEAR